MNKVRFAQSVYPLFVHRRSVVILARIGPYIYCDHLPPSSFTFPFLFSSPIPTRRITSSSSTLTKSSSITITSTYAIPHLYLGFVSLQLIRVEGKFLFFFFFFVVFFLPAVSNSSSFLSSLVSLSSSLPLPFETIVSRKHG